MHMTDPFHLECHGESVLGSTEPSFGTSGNDVLSQANLDDRHVYPANYTQEMLEVFPTEDKERRYIDSDFRGKLVPEAKSPGVNCVNWSYHSVLSPNFPQNLVHRRTGSCRGL